MLFPQKTLNCGGRLLMLDRPRIMGILNLTPDSFYAGSRLTDVDAVLRAAERMLTAGADILDLGGMSSRPGAAVLDAATELQRVIPNLQRVHEAFPDAILSVDTVRARVAREAVAAGATMINDISAGSLDAAMYPTVAELGVPYVLMHMQGRPETMQQQTHYEQDVTLAVFDFLTAELGKLRALGVHDVIIDPGFGFGKTIDQNYQILNKLHTFQIMEVPILAGISRKSMIWKTIGKSASEALAGTCALHVKCLDEGARILRVHDVAAAHDVIAVWQRSQVE